MKVREWLKNNSEQDNGDIFDFEVSGQDARGWIDDVVMGYSSEEDVAKGYFKDEFPLGAWLNEYKGIYIIGMDEEDVEDYKVYETKEEALNELKKLENSLHEGIDEQIEKFQIAIGELNSRIRIEVKEEYNNSGNWYSYNIYLDDNLFIDGDFSLDSTEVIEDVKNIDALNLSLEEEYGISVDSVSKISGSLWKKYYNIQMRKNGYTIDRDIEISGTTQGRTKKLVDYIGDLDIDDILEEFAENEE